MIAASAVIDGNAFVHETSDVWHFAVIQRGALIGAKCSIGSHVEIGRDSQIGQGTRIGKGTFLPARSLIGEKVFIGPNVTFCDDKRPLAGNKGYFAQPPVVEEGASIGAGVVVLPGIRIGAWSLIGAGSVVTKDVPAGATLRGEPARILSLGCLPGENIKI